VKRTACSCVLFLVMVLSTLAVGTTAQSLRTVPRELKAVFTGSFTFEQWGPNWYDLYTIGSAAGTAQHLGQARLITKHTPTLTGDLVDGTFTLVAANGDEIQGTYTGFASGIPGNDLAYQGTAAFVITGGTGRFAQATGTFDTTFLEVFTDYSYALALTSWSLQGTVNY
jgi:hypothetical protein